MTTYTIGFMSDGGDFRVVATLNNNGGFYTDEQFEEIRKALFNALSDEAGARGYILECLDRQDAPTYADLEG